MTYSELNKSTGIMNWWHNISKCPELTAKQKLLMMEMLRRHRYKGELSGWGSIYADTGYMWYTGDFILLFHEVCKGGRGYEYTREKRHLLEDAVKEMRCLK